MASVQSRVSNGVAVLTLANPPVNALSAPMRAALAQAIAKANADPAVTASVIAAEGKVFVAGADISEFGKPPQSPSLPDVLSAIVASSKPVVAALQGLALGGGLELALACQGRVAAPAARLGLPEVKLGLIPGAGGTQRLPPLIGAAPAFAMMASGDPICAEQALTLGLVDEIAAQDLIAAASALALRLASGAASSAQPARDKRTPEDRAAFETAAAAALKSAGRAANIPALVEAVRAGLDHPIEAGLEVERAKFLALMSDPGSKALRHLFFAERAAGRVPGLEAALPTRPLTRAAVIGAGTMGGGIAMSLAKAGIAVTLIEIEQAALDAGLARVRATYASSVKRGSLTEAAMNDQLGRITPAVGLEAAADADLVVEAAFEDMGVKQTIFSTLERVTRPGAILATNTSYLDVNAIAAITSRPQDVVGLHFFSPANVMRLLEVVRGAQTAPDVLKTALELGRRIGKLPVVVGVCHGFVGNRMLAQRSKAAERLLLAGALPHEVDAAVTEFGFRMGPFAMADLAGIDVGWRARKAAGTRAPVADTLAEQGRFGQKTKRGFYLYPEGARVGVRDPETEALILALSQEAGITRRTFSAEEIRARLFFPMVNEGAKILKEGIALRSSDIDLVWVNGYNWPALTGGPMYWAEQVGLDHLVAGLRAFAAETSDASLEPAPLLVERARGSGVFTEAP